MSLFVHPLSSSTLCPGNLAQAPTSLRGMPVSSSAHVQHLDGGTPLVEGNTIKFLCTLASVSMDCVLQQGVDG